MTVAQDEGRDLTREEAEQCIAGAPEWVYLMTAGRVVKVGYSINPLRRLREIYSNLAANPDAAYRVIMAADISPLLKMQLMTAPSGPGADRSLLTLRSITPAGRDLEQSLLRQHGKHRRFGEWLRVAALPSLDESAPWMRLDFTYARLVGRSS
jgi:hypothetical protein